MFRRVGLVALFLAILAVLPLGAQSQQASSMLTGVDPAQRVLQPIDLTKAARAFKANSNIIRTPTMPGSSFSLTNLMPKVRMPSWPIQIGSSNVPKAPVRRNKS